MKSTSTAAQVSAALPQAGVRERIHHEVTSWFGDNARPLPWRAPDCPPWGVYVSEVMSHQTPVARVEPVWRNWMRRWPRPAALAAESPGEAVREWGRLGYPRRALRLHESARVMVAEHGGEVPASHDELLTLPGVGPYTAAAVASFAFGERTTVVDINIRRVEARAIRGAPLPEASPSRFETALAAALVPLEPEASVAWNVAAMELGALVCTARSPRCEQCPIRVDCAWVAAGSPVYDGPARRVQAWEGTDRQVRGRIIGLLRDADAPVPAAEVDALWPDAAQRERAAASLVADGLIEHVGDDVPAYRLPR